MMTDKPSSNTRRADTLAWLVLAATVLGSFVVLSMIFEVSGCDDGCNYATLEFASKGFWLLSLALGVATIALHLALRRRVPRAWIIPAVGLGIEVVALLVAIVAIRGALS